MDYYRIKPNNTILVLNATYEPINFCNWRRAVVLLMKEKAQLLSGTVIRLVNYIKIPYRLMMSHKPSRAMIYKRDGNKCQYCGATKDLTIDHIQPRSLGGQDTWENLVTACSTCNSKKGGKLLKETNMVLRKKPSAPLNRITLSLDKTNNPEWKEYCYV
ncbi:MAG: HNH endonuclease [Pelagibacteraceae bacterium]